MVYKLSLCLRLHLSLAITYRVDLGMVRCVMNVDGARPDDR